MTSSEPSGLAASIDRFKRAEDLHVHLRACFNALAQAKFDDPHLKAFVSKTLEIHNLHSTVSVPEVLGKLEPFHTGLIVTEAQLLTDTAEEAQLRLRLLLRNSRAIYCAPETQDDESYAQAVPAIQDEIAGLHQVYVPYAYQTAGNFLTAANSYPSAIQFKEDVASIENRRVNIAQAFGKIDESLRQGPLSDTEMRAFYAPYADMSDTPRTDYAENTARLAALHMSVAENNMARLGLRITQAYLCLTDAATITEISRTPVLRDDFEIKLQETANAFQRTELHLFGGTLTDGSVRGAKQFLETSAHYRP